MGKTVVMGSVPKSYRYAYQAAIMLKESGHDFIPLGIQDGEVLGESILNVYQEPKIDDVETLTLYINPTRQKEWYDYMISLRPKRIIFNPGTENQEFKIRAQKEGIECIEACTLVMLSTGVY